jgi:hypothetical protein
MTIRSKSGCIESTKTAAAVLMVSFAACGGMSQTNGGLAPPARPAVAGRRRQLRVLGASTVLPAPPRSLVTSTSARHRHHRFNPPCTSPARFTRATTRRAGCADLSIAWRPGRARLWAQPHRPGSGGERWPESADTTVGVTGALTLDGGGDSTAVWIFQVGTAITTATSSSVVMAGSGKPGNVFWQVGSSATIGTATAFQGNLLAYASITLVSGSSVVGRALALNAAVTLDNNRISLGN